jgi:hypothetical protein
MPPDGNASSGAADEPLPERQTQFDAQSGENQAAAAGSTRHCVPAASTQPPGYPPAGAEMLPSENQTQIPALTTAPDPENQTQFPPQPH